MDIAGKVKIFRTRFHGRQDIYGRARQVDDHKTGGRRTVYSPVCDKVFTEVCHLKRDTGKGCGECEHKALRQVDDLAIEMHISGEAMHNFFPLLDEGVIRFGAIDFDLKPGKESLGYDFFEVEKFCGVLRAQGIGYGIARSSSAGYHVYIFFREPYQAARFRTVISKVFAWVGFTHYVKEGIKKSLPEIFPKRDFLMDGAVGNGITPPMVEPLFLKARKCWVDDKDQIIGGDLSDGVDHIDLTIEAQWKYLDELPWANPDRFDAILEEYALKVDSVETLKKRMECTSESHDISGEGISRPHGSMEKVVFGCEAFRYLAAKVQKGHDPSHHEGMALWNMAINTVDGRDWFKQNVPTWGRNNAEIRQLELAAKAGYKPYSCETMKVNGICMKDGLCLEAAPRPKSSEGSGSEGVLDNVEETEQKRYNPYRYSYGKGVEFFQELLDQATKMQSMPDEAREEALRSLAGRAQVLDQRQHNQFKEHINLIQKKLKIPKIQTGSIFREAEIAHMKRQKALLEGDPATYKVGSNTYRKRYGGGKYGYYLVVEGKRKLHETLLCEIDVVIQEERYCTGDDADQTFYVGIVKSAKDEKNFTISVADWTSDSRFLEIFTSIVGTLFSPLRKHIEYIRQAIIGWCHERHLTKKVLTHTTQGFFQQGYLMPSVTVDASGLRQTADGALDISNKDVVKNLDWIILDEPVFKNTLRHIIDDFLHAWPEEWTFIGLAHAFRPLIMYFMGWTTRPTLFIDGLSGIGKSKFTMALQKFWGYSFEKFVNLTVTQKYLEELAHTFKDALLVIDDFKGLTKQQENVVLHYIQYGHDGSSSGKLNRDSSMRKPRFNRATTIMSGEKFIQNHASVVARTILIEAHKFDNRLTRPAYERVLVMQNNYAGITPRFLHWLFGREKKPLDEDFQQIQTGFEDTARGRQNSPRVAESIAGNVLSFKLLTQFFEAAGAISSTEREMLNQQHFKIAQRIFGSMISRCEEEQEAILFKTTLVNLILSGRLTVSGFNTPYENAGPMVGYVKDENRQIGYYYPDIVVEQVNLALRTQEVVFTSRVLGRQLFDLGISIERDPDHYSKLVTKDGARIRVWVFDHSKLGLVTDDVSQSEDLQTPAAVIKLRPGVEEFRKSGGLF